MAPAEQTLDPDAVRAALRALAPRLAAGGFPTQLDRALGTLPTTFGSYFEALETDPVDLGRTDFSLTMALAATLTERTPTTARTLVAATGPEAVTYYGDLHLEGDLELDGTLIVLGDLTVDGIVTDTFAWSQLHVTGNLVAAGVRCQFSCWVGGTLRAEIVLVGAHGSVSALEGVETPLAIHTHPEGDGFVGEVRAETKLELGGDPSAWLARVPEELVRDVEGTLVVDEEALVRRAASKQPIFWRTTSG